MDATLLVALSLTATPPARKEKVCSCHPGADGVLEGGILYLPAPAEEIAAFNTWPSTTIESNGPSTNRVDITFVGDGFQAAQLPTYATLVSQRWATIRSREPYVSYHRYFNAHRVDVVSTDAGVDNDPSQGVARNTALDMGFWCSGIERLLCVNTTKALNAGLCAPGRDQVLAVANSTKYGGAGYPTADVCTFSGLEGNSLEVALHELGHSFGDLADEYDYADGTTYAGPEVPESNVSILTQASMQSAGTKWAPWLGVNLPGVGLHGSFEGARYYQYGIRRPTGDSLMRSLGQPFNGPSLEQMIVKVHQATSMIDAATPAAGTSLVRGATVSATLVQPSQHALSLQWFRGNDAIPGATSASIATAGIAVAPAGTQLRLVIVDPTTKVRNESLRNTHLRETYVWTLLPDACRADIDLDGVVGGSDLARVLSQWGLGAVVAGRADVNGDNIVGADDLALLLSAWGNCGS